MVKKKNKKINKKAWVVTVNMGYGHQRASHPFSNIAQDGIMVANDYQGIPAGDKRKWESSRKFYEMVSRAKHLPLIGEYIFGLYDKYFQSIASFYPKRDLSKPNLQLKQMYRMINKGWGKNLIASLNKKNLKLPFLTTFFVPAFFAEEHGYEGEIYCVLCDADISRTWAPLAPAKSRIKYLAPNNRVLERLKLYGVPKKNIYLTGFPLPKENIGGRDMKIIKKDLWHRIHHLDPKHHFIDKYKESLVHYLGKENGQHTKDCKLNLTFAVGGAGAQRELGMDIVKSLKEKIKKDELIVNLVAGVHKDVYDYFTKNIKKVGLSKYLNKNINILFEKDKNIYFDKFNKLLRRTDILWTKPSELTFYNGLGIPIIMAPPIGSQEVFNQRWLRAIGGGVNQLNPKHTHQWLPDWLGSGWLAEAALQGFLDAPKFGAYKIEELLFKGKIKKEDGVELL